jgi:thymidylate synthase (FAD)
MLVSPRSFLALMVKYVPQSHEILTPIDGSDVLKRIEQAGRICYKSEDLSTADSHLRFARMIVGREHFSVIEHVNVTVKFITNRGVTHELVRHRTASYSQESTRYCNYAKGKFDGEITVIDQQGLFTDPLHYKLWKEAMAEAERAYLDLVERGVPPQVARGVLPIDLKSEIIITANLREWRHIFEMRTSEAAHPNIRSLMKGLLIEFKQKIPVIFDDID